MICLTRVYVYILLFFCFLQDPDAIQNPFNMDDHEINPITPGVNAGGGVTPWHDADYDNPVSVGPMVRNFFSSISVFLFCGSRKILIISFVS